MTGVTGELKSNNHPGGYNAEEEAQWVIEAPFGTKIQLKFTAFDTEKNYDIVSIFIGERSVATSTAIGSLGGFIATEDLPTFSSTNNFMILRFISDDTVEPGGFKAEWSTGKRLLCKMSTFEATTCSLIAKRNIANIALSSFCRVHMQHRRADRLWI